MALASCPGPPGAAAESAQDAPGLELGVGAFPGRPWPGMCSVGVLLPSRLAAAPNQPRSGTRPGASHRPAGAAQHRLLASRATQEDCGPGEGQVTGEYASGEILDEDQDGTLGSRFLYAFWRLREQRIATQQSADPATAHG